MTDRNTEIEVFLETAGWGGASVTLLAKDASYRVYHRVTRAADRAVLMDAPPGLEDVRPFLDIAAQLHRFGYSAPAILAQDVTAGLLLLEDFGDRTFTRILSDPGERTWNEETLYSLAVDVLADLHERAPIVGFQAPSYDGNRLVEEADRMLRWYAPLMLGDVMAEDAAEDYRAAWRAAVPAMTWGPDTLVLRDFHVDNLMILEGREGLARCGLLDFQDALTGSPAYDLVSLLQDARRDLGEGLEARMLERYRARRNLTDWDAFLQAYHALGAQRAIKILGQFGRQQGFFGRTSYMVHIPRCWAHIERDLAKAGLDDVIAWLDRELPPPLRTVPEPNTRLPESISPEIKR
ncbi:MAG: phosphotransferase [Alphaproteobacteria bacterium]|nr:phosphotransferase [Alphaproteobacteria bacterium]